MILLADGRTLACGAVVLTTGTFLRGKTFIGDETLFEGRAGEAPSVALADTIERLGFQFGRLKTGTPARLDSRTIAWSGLDVQPPDDVLVPFSTLTDEGPSWLPSSFGNAHIPHVGLDMATERRLLKVALS